MRGCALQRYAEALAGGDGFDPTAMAAFCYSSGVSEHGEGAALAAALPGMPLQVPLCMFLLFQSNSVRDETAVTSHLSVAPPFCSCGARTYRRPILFPDT